MSDIAIRVENLSKLYRIGGKQEKYRTLRDTLSDAATAPFRRVRSAFQRNGQARTEDNTIWALKDVSFEVKRGEVVGVIGRNGAGKSTLLKILSRITEPSSGRAEIHGRVGSLLEVGTGFHPELTGRENIYLNGAILGMKRAELERRFDEIVDFAEVEKFIDTPVKHYSSGMYLRLAFAVAAHMETEILLVDEVLAVGDAQFQKKCLGKMGEVAQQGRTVLFVSHNMGAVRSLCNEGLLLDSGRLNQHGDISGTINAYYVSIGALQGRETSRGPAKANSSGFGPIVIGQNEKGATTQSGELSVSTTLTVNQDIPGFYIFCILEDMQGRTVFHLREQSRDLGLDHIPAGSYVMALKLPPLWLNPGLYSIHFKVLFSGGRTSERHVSDKFPLDIAGVSSVSDSILHPQALWSVEQSGKRT